MNITEKGIIIILFSFVFNLSANWITFQYDNNHSGFNPQANIKLPLILKYTLNLESESINYSSAIICDKVIYIGLSNGKLKALDLDTGLLKWEFITKGEIYVSSSIKNNTIYFGSTDGNLYALNKDGNLKWKYYTGNNINSSPIVENENIYLGCNNGNIYALNTNGNLLWKKEIGNYIWTSPALFKEKLVIGTINGIIYCLNSTNGNILWSYNLVI